MPEFCSDGRWTKIETFEYTRLREAAGVGDFNTDQDKETTPTLTLNTIQDPDTLKKGKVNRIHYRVNPANAITYTLRIWQAAIAADYESNINLLYESPAAQADDEDYDRAELNIPFILATEGEIYYSLDLSAASGNVQGFIVVSGEVWS